MDAFGYLVILTSIVLGLGITRVLTGLGRVLQIRGHLAFYWVHLMWALNLFLYLLRSNLGILFRWHTRTEWNFFIFLFVLLSPTIGFLMSVLLFPEPMEEGINLKQHYYANHRWFFTLGSLLALLDAVDTYLKGWEHFVAQGVTYRILPHPHVHADHHRSAHQKRAIPPLLRGLLLLYLLLFIYINLNVLE